MSFRNRTSCLASVGAAAIGVVTLLTADPAARGRTLVAVLAHADDESPAGPMLARYAREGVNVHIIVVTDGGMGFGAKGPGPDPKAASEALVKVRAEEARCAAAALGAAPPVLLGFPDAKLGDYLADRGLLFQATARLAAEFQRLRPDAIVTWGPDGGVGHPDHRMVNSLVMQIVRAGAPGATDRVFFMYIAPEGFQAINPQRALPPFVIPDAKLLTTQIAFNAEDQAAAGRAMACHRSQFQLDVLSKMLPLMAKSWNGRIPLAPAMAHHAGTDLFR
jgi:LmbE family N-acetylglucosaminyl deacetylase